MTEKEINDVNTGRWSAFIIYAMFLALIGFGISLYLAFHHVDVMVKGSTDAFCNINALFNCDDVAKSKYAEVLGIPLGVYGCGYFLGCLVLLGVAFFKSEYSRDSIQTYVLMVVIGVFASIIYGSISFFSVGALCIGCMGVYLTTIIQAVLLYFFRTEVPGGWSIKGIGNGATYPILALALVVGIYQYVKPTSRDFKKDVPQIPGGRDGEAAGPKTILASDKVDIKVDRSPYSGFGEDYREGSDDAKVIIIEFSDFECPACQYAFQTMKELKAEFGGRILVVFKNYPLDTKCNSSIKRKFHNYACDAAFIARCAGQEGKFWKFHDLVYENQKELNQENLVKWAASLGIGKDKVDECLKSESIKAKINDDIEVANKVPVDGTPTIFINGRRVVGNSSLSSMKAEISKLLSE
ncbi:MAG: thioredoxin domain-containing protein [Oligoflexales bacterium]|nr:thioredoxin domain-containing protein [Oligoflexales bacterium]